MLVVQCTGWTVLSFEARVLLRVCNLTVRTYQLLNYGLFVPFESYSK